jgi:hypothetical protein
VPVLAYLTHLQTHQKGLDMARTNRRLTPFEIKNLKRPGMYPDGDCLYLQVTEGAQGNIRKSWLFRYAIPGGKKPSASGRPYRKIHAMGLGPERTVGLALAREKAQEFRRLLLDGIDPLTHREVARAQRLAEAAKALTFDEAAKQYIQEHSGSWVPGHRSAWLTSLRDYVSPKIGSLSVADIDTAAVLRVLKPIWQEMATANRVRGRIERILASRI